MPKNNKATIKTIPYKDIVRAPYSNGAIERNDFPGFHEDYLAIHSLLRKYEPANILEIGTSSGSGTNIICNAMRVRKGIIGKLFDKKKVVSIDVPVGTDASIIYPDKEDGHPSAPGIYCTFPFTQLFGSSIKFDFEPHYPLEAWFIDGKHDFEYCSKDTKQALKSEPILILWHDIQIKGVRDAVEETMAGQPYELYRVGKTRVAYAVKK